MNNYSFSAIVGQEDMKLALLLAAINPAVCGVLIKGEKGTGKSTAARALSAILPEVETVVGCPFNCLAKAPVCPDCAEKLDRGDDFIHERRPAPFINLPLSVTEDALFGSIDLETAIKYGRRRLQPGIVARANHGVLYIDEVNLLENHLMAGLLDLSGSGMNRVEREGVSVVHPSAFILVASMNPEEGEVPPQFLDRFGLCVTVEGEKELERRIEIMQRRLAFEANPRAFLKGFAIKDQALKEKIQRARLILPSVWIPGHVKQFIAELCRKNHVAGHRADLVIQAASSARAALEGRVEVNYEDVETVAEMALSHRRREASSSERHNGEKDQEKKDKHSPPPSHEKKEESANTDKDSRQSNDSRQGGEKKEPRSQGQSPQEGKPSLDDEETTPRQGSDQRFSVGETFEVRSFHSEDRRKTRRVQFGRRSRTINKLTRGRYVRARRPREKTSDLALDATLRAAAPYQIVRRGENGRFVVLEQDFREKVREAKTGHLLLFCVDGSGSMGAEARMTETKGSIMSLLMSAYQKRDRVGLIVFRGADAKVILPPTNSVDLAAKLLEDLPVGGSTPLSAGIVKTGKLIGFISRKEPDIKVTVIFVTDGRGNVKLTDQLPRKEVELMAKALASSYPHAEFVVIDTETGSLKFGLAKRLAEILSAKYFTPEALKAENMVKILKYGAMS